MNTPLSSDSPIRALLARLESLAAAPAAPYAVPPRWLDPDSADTSPAAVHPAQFLASAVRRILAAAPAALTPP
ncbi:MAG: hypothetical protein IK066_05685, partial [Kiritimatiellae bacterium]|nr:hypothetical protein [Kiritimatiellia bacterium]